jgi:hypothetical protein
VSRSVPLALLLVLVAVASARADDPMPPVEPPSTSVGLEARLALLRGEGADLAPTAGFGFGLSARRRWFAGGRLGLWGGLDLAYDRFARTIRVTGINQGGMMVAYDDTQQLTHTSFAALQTARVDLGSWSGVLAAGGGFSVAHFFRPADGVNAQEDLSSFVPLVCAQATVGYQLWPRTALELSFHYNWLFSDDRIGTRKPFTDVMDVSLGAAYRF